MHGWFQKLFKSSSSPTQNEQKDKVTSRSTSPPETSSSSPKPQKQSVLSSQMRLKCKYDLLVCHSNADGDIEEAKRLVSYLETSPRSLRCFLWQRDVCPGGAVPTEFCQAMQDSHLQLLLITPDFLQDEWCKYMMHQALAEGPVSNRLIPLMHNLSHSEYPLELRFRFYIDLNRNTERGYNQINRTVLNYLEELVRKEKTRETNIDDSNRRINEDGSSQGKQLVINNDPTETSVPQEMTQMRHHMTHS